MIVTILLLLVDLLLIYIYLQSFYRYFKIRRIPYLRPKFLLGCADEIFLGKKSMIEFQCSIYRQLGANKILGLFMFMKPTLYIGNVDWIRDILVRDFHCFCDRGLKFDTQSEPLTRHLFHLEGDQWKYMRKKVMPMFTPSGVSTLLPRLVESGLKLSNYVGSIAPGSDLDLKDILGRYAADSIGNCAFGIDSQALTSKRARFYVMSKKIFEPRMRTLLKLVLPNIPSFIAEYLDIKMIGSDISEYFTGIMREQIGRRRGGTRANDFMDYMLDLQKKTSDSDEMPITDDLIMAHCFMFFIAGYENATSVTCITLVVLAQNPDIQEKLFEEIHQFCSTITDLSDISYQELHNLVYLDMVVSEIIRLYPPATAVVRECTQDYVLSGSDITLNKGLQLVIPVSGLHRDPQYFPNPDVFNPENFSTEAVAARNRYVYIPFGEGLRYCIGRRFGRTKVKMALLLLVRSYKFHPSPKMTVPFQFEKKTFTTSLLGGAWVRIEKRQKL